MTFAGARQIFAARHHAGGSLGVFLGLAGLASALFLASCASPPPLTNSTGTSIVSSETAFAYPAPGGPVVTTVLERRYANATEQDILLSTSARTPGQNMLRVQMFGPVDASLAGESRLRDGYLPIGDVGSEMRQLLPGVRMQRSPFYVQNKYGPFGYAVGRSASGDTCLYGWQRITSTGSTETLIGNKGSVQVRLRLCDQNASEQHLLDVMYGYTISSSFKTRNWNPYGNAPAPDDAIGKSGHPIYPLGATQFGTVTAPQAAPAKTVRRIARPRVMAEQAPATPDPDQPIGPTVPPPPGGQTADSQAPGPVPAPPDSAAAGGPATVVPPPPCAHSGASGCNQ
ncbi:cellulose biosynthesis protein BcsN [Mesorhizobium sp. CU2]|uniref:cellulose biosynthesis protein BcsN n=1 Tax=unclassified Mesorhizobium TaxID=325217 RepID=UPI001127B82F|nr:MULTISPECIES: cellulose biosynthesis protein BcsN [unclassified Mesorhizobium]TPN81823.1 cellulose biosynthesis protein BcsN [Mesorhizobium sp. CU3]TPO07114.1 cellulose biosynthesis protein BcsN [Mesorhizobium sp. CU2]